MAANPQRKRKRKRRWLILICGLLAAYVGACTILAYHFTHPRRMITPPPPEFLTEEIPTSDVKEPAWATPNLASAPVVFVLAFGLKGSRSTWAPLMQVMEHNNVAAVCPCMPGQDASPVSGVGFGPKEAKVIVDTVAWIRQQRPDHPKIILMGDSMGGAASWIASAMDPSVDGVITDCAYSHFLPTAKQYLDMALPHASVLFAPVIWIGSQMVHVDPSSINPVDQAKLWHGRPALVIAAGADREIPKGQAEELATAAGCPVWTVPGAAHARDYVTAPADYWSHVKTVIDEVTQSHP